MSIDHVQLGLENEAFFDEAVESPTAQRWQQLRCYGFKVGSHGLLVSQGSYCELLTQWQLARLPNAPQHLLGLTNMRGNIVPVYQVEPLLGLEPVGTRYALAIGSLPNTAALAIASKPIQLDLASLAPEEAVQDLPDFLKPFVTATYADRGEPWSTLDHEELFTNLAGTQ